MRLPYSTLRRLALLDVVYVVGLFSRGVAVDLTLLPSIYTGGFVAAIVAPYLV
ncbi:hypothetical protein [Salinilacihabitans rarus]|uniref:hypothetical protein n=1 Tax=Salinilacihabitans rarus TaxID=2961596 RepID=UPI0020C90D24|nr:hypothetical protein [Salinilacihabitans rarus]